MELPPGIDGSRASRDFVPGAIGPCWVGSAVYSQVIAMTASVFRTIRTQRARLLRSQTISRRVAARQWAET